MSPIMQKTSRRTLPAPPQIAAFIKAVIQAAEPALPQVLDSFNVWSYPKGDLYQWIDVLNRMDSILEAACDKYSLVDRVQEVSFDEQDRLLLKSVLRFSVFLLDHCANRGLYASGNHVDNLLHTTDLEVLEQALHVGLRLAQRASDQRSGRSHYPLTLDKLWELASSLQLFDGDVGTSMTNLIGPQSPSDNDCSNLQFPCYRSLAESVMFAKLSAVSLEEADQGLLQSPSSSSSDLKRSLGTTKPTPYLTSQDQKLVEGIITVRIPLQAIRERSIEDLYREVIEETHLPSQYRYKLMLRIRLCKHYKDSSKLERLVSIRILALACASYVANEPTLQSRLATLETDLIAQLAQLTRPEYQDSHNIAAVSLWALEAIAHHRPRLSEVLNVLGASIDHGILMYTLRKTFNDICKGIMPRSPDLIEAQISLLYYLSTTNVAGSMLCSAGLIQLLLHLIADCHTGAYRVLVKAVNLLDHLVYGFTQAFNIFCEAQGVNIIVERIKREVQQDTENASQFLLHKESNRTDYAMTHENFSFLKTLLKFIVHMMQSSGTADGLRALIESSLLWSMQTIYKNANIFGSSIFASTTNIMAAFIHNEPSSYQVLQEAKLPQLFLDSVSNAIFPAADVLTSIPHAFGAICLNSTGLTLFNSYEPIPRLLTIFTSPKHCEVLRDSDLAGLLGSSVDELVRHQPSLRDTVLRGILQTLEDILALSSESRSSSLGACKFAASEDNKVSQEVPESPESIFIDEDGITRPIIVLHIDIVCRFLEGYLQNPNQSQHFLSQGGLNAILAFYKLRCLPYDFAKSHAALSISHILRLVCEVDVPAFLNSVFQDLKSALSSLQPLISHQKNDSVHRSDSFFSPFLEGTTTPLLGHELAQNLQIIHSFVVLLSDLYAAPLSSSSRSASPFSYTFATNQEHAQLLQELGLLHRALIWEDVKVAKDLNPAWLAATQPRDDHDVAQKSESDIPKLDSAEIASNRFRDLKMVRFFLCQIPPCIIPFFQGLTKMLSSNRKASEHGHRTTTMKVARMISQVLEGHLDFNLELMSFANRPCHQGFRLMALTFYQMLICDDRNSNELMTTLLNEFEHGLDLLSQLTAICWQELFELELTETSDTVAIHASDDRTPKAEEARITASLQLLLNLWVKLTSERCFMSSPQTAFLDSKDRHKDRSAVFDPKFALLHMRGKILHAIADIWQGPSFGKVSAPIARIALKILSQCFEDAHPLDTRPSAQAQPSSLNGDQIMLDTVLDDSSQPGPSSFLDTIPAPVLTDRVSEIKQGIYADMAPQSLEHLATFGDEIVFEVADLLTRLNAAEDKSDSWVQDILGTFVGTMQSVVETINHPNNPKQFKAMAHLLVNLFSQESFLNAYIEEYGLGLDVLLGMAESIELTTELPADTLAGFTNVLMICDTILAHEENQAFVTSLSEAIVAASTTMSEESCEKGAQLDRLFILCCRVLPFVRSGIALVSTLRPLARITSTAKARSREFTAEHLRNLLSAINSVIVDCDQNTKVTFILILRHMIETPGVLHNAFSHMIQNLWHEDKAKRHDIDQFVKQTLPIALRDGQLFLRISQELCSLAEHDSNKSTIGLQVNAYPDQCSGSEQEDIPSLVNEENICEQASSPGSTVRVLLTELVECQTRYLEELSNNNRNSRDLEFGASSKKSMQSFKPEENQAYLYICMLLQSLTELVASFEQCKNEFIPSVAARLQTSDMVSQSAWSSYPSILHWYLKEIIAILPVKSGAAHEGSPLQKKIQATVTFWSRSVVTALCSEVVVESQASQARQSQLLDCLYENLATVVHTDDTISNRYGQIIAYASLIERLTSAVIDDLPESSAPSYRAQDSMGRLMLEKNFVGLLTAILSELDYRFPLSQEVVKEVMRPLKHLTKIATRLTELSSPIASTQSSALPESEHQATFEETDADVTMPTVHREETPNLYRHSALGMFEADLHESDEDSYDSDEDDDEEMYYDEMDFEADGSETGSAVSDEEVDLDRDDSFRHHDIEIIVDEDDRDEDDAERTSIDSENESDSITSSDSASYSDGFDILAGTEDSAEWNDEADIAGHDDDQPMPDVLPSNLAISQGLPQFTGEETSTFVIDDVPRRLRTDSMVEQMMHAENEDESDEASVLMQSVDGQSGDDDDSLGDELWNWGADTGEEASGSHLPVNIANRLWASLASGHQQGDMLQGHSSSGIQVLRHPRTTNLLRGSPTTPRSAINNPLLVRPTTASSDIQSHEASDQSSHWIESIEALIGGGAVQLIGDIMRRPIAATQGNGTGIPIHIQLGNRHNHDSPQIDIVPGNLNHSHVIRQVATSPGPESAAAFHSKHSAQRYQDEALLRFPNGHSGHHAAVVKSLTTLLRAPATIHHEDTPEEKDTNDSKGTEKLSGENSENDSVVASSEVQSAPQDRGLDDRSDAEINIAPEIESADISHPRQVIDVSGRSVDITGLGIDLEFLEALPSEMRAEVLTQHLRERRLDSSNTSTTPDLSPEFLEALPVEIRAELLQQEAADRRRNERLSREATSRTSAVSSSLVSTLSPALRRVIMSASGESPQLLSERIDTNGSDPLRTSAGPDSTASGTSKPKRVETVQLIERQGVASILQLLFQPTTSLRTAIHDLLLNLCGNRSTRIEILSQLLGLYRDSTSETVSIEKCWNAVMRRARNTVNGESPAKTPKKSSSDAPLTLTLSSPQTLMLQCLKVLSYLMKFNQQVPSFFLLEHELIRKSFKARSKSREFSVKSSKYPVNDLMASLSKSFVLKDSEILELLSSVISSVTRPLLLLAKKGPEITPPAAADAVTEDPRTSAPSADSVKSIKRDLVPPDVPQHNFRLIVNLVTADACTGRTFQNTLASIYHLSALHNARSVILEELVKQGQQFVSQTETDLTGLARELSSVQKADDLPRTVMAHFSSSNSVQTKFLRLLKTIDHLEHDVAERLELTDTTNTIQSRDKSWLAVVVNNPIWSALGYCLTNIQGRPQLASVATLLLPSIEALMVVCRTSTEVQSSSPRQSSIRHEELDTSSKLFIEFTDSHRSVLNQMVRNNPSLMSGSFALLTKNPKVLDFDNKRNYFHRKVRDKGLGRMQYPPIHVNVRRDAVFLDSYKDLHFKSGNEIKYSKLNIRFVGEEGIDAGGVSREWFQVLARQMFDPNYALFVPVNADRNTFHPNKTSGINPEHLLFFKFVGRIVGKALYDGRLLDCHFSRPIYCKMLGKNVSLKDMETLDLEYYKSLLWMLNNDITDVISETFSVERDDFGEITTIDLIPDGRNVLVTEQSKSDYVARVTEYRLLKSVSEQLSHFMIGFNEIIPADLISIFNEKELELLISGLPDIDADDWKNNTEYQNYTTSDPQIQWFWRAVRSFDDEQRARLLQFCTGSSRLPIEGFAHLEGMHGVQKFNIHRDYTKGARLPQSHTCFNQLDLPEYESYESLRSSLLTAISEGSEGFGFA